MLAASTGKRNVTVWRPSVRPSVCPVCILTVTWGSMRCGQRTLRPDNKEDRHICYVQNHFYFASPLRNGHKFDDDGADVEDNGDVVYHGLSRLVR